MTTAQAQAIINNSGLTNDEKDKLLGICSTQPDIYKQIVDGQAAVTNMDVALRAVIALCSTKKRFSSTTLEKNLVARSDNSSGEPSYFVELIQSMSGYSVVQEEKEKEKEKTE